MPHSPGEGSLHNTANQNKAIQPFSCLDYPQLIVKEKHKHKRPWTNQSGPENKNHGWQAFTVWTSYISMWFSIFLGLQLQLWVHCRRMRAPMYLQQPGWSIQPKKLAIKHQSVAHRWLWTPPEKLQWSWTSKTRAVSKWWEEPVSAVN